MSSERDVMPPQPDGIVPGDAGSASLPIDGREETALLDDLRVVIDRQATAEVRVRASPRKLEGTQIGRYAINRLIGEGGMASVYRAVDVDNRRDVAIKILKPQYEADRDVLARFEREARSIASIRHENVVQIFGFLREDDVCAIVMELLTGGSLRRRLDSSQGSLPAVSIAEAVTLIAQATRCVDDAVADAAFAARSAVAALAHAGKPIKEFWESSRREYKRLRAATLGQEGTIGRPISPDLFEDA